MSEAASVPALVVSAVDTTVEVQGGEGAVIGRDPGADIVVADLRVSRRHARVAWEPDHGWVLSDLGSRSGTHLDGVRCERLPLTSATKVRLGDPVDGVEVTLRPDGANGASSDAGRTVVTIGRDAGNDVVIDDLLVSRRHAVVRELAAGQWEVEDLGSANGTFVSGGSVERAPLSDGQVFSVARHPLRLRGGEVREATPRGVPALQCADAGVTLRKGPRILDGVSLTAEAGTLTAVLGPTGAGKSTLLKVLTGAQRPTEGTVLVDGRDLHANLGAVQPLLGYVPQDDILHPQLTVRRALTFGAELRLPPDVAEEDIDRLVARVMAELGLSHRADVRIDRLSGGQRKRTSVALELLTTPSVLFLDEPTSGLDPAYEKSVMELLRSLADAGRTVVVVTHSIQSLELCDQLLLLASGGKRAYLGPPGGALNAFDRRDYAEVFADLERGVVTATPADDEPLQHGTGSAQAPPAWGRPDPRDPEDRQRWHRQLRTLLRRQRAVVLADRRVLLFYLAAVLVPGLLILVVVEPGALAPAGPEPNPDARTLLGAVVVSAVAIGAANTLREIVKEQAILDRERAAGVSESAYLLSKAVVFGVITAAQAALLVLVALATAEGPQGGVFVLPGRLEVVLAVVLAAVAAATLGLLVSALVSSSEKAMAMISVIFVVQWLLSGVAFDLVESRPMRVVGYATSANWGMAAVASTADLQRLEHSCDHAPEPGEFASSQAVGSPDPLPPDSSDPLPPDSSDPRPPDSSDPLPPGEDDLAAEGAGGAADAPGEAAEGVEGLVEQPEGDGSDPDGSGLDRDGVSEGPEGPGEGPVAGDAPPHAGPLPDERYCDARWEHRALGWLANVGALALLVVAPLPLVVARLRRR